MGAKTALLAFADRLVPDALRTAAMTGPDSGTAAAAEALVRRVFPNHLVEPHESCNLWEAVYPPDDVTYALSIRGLDLVCDRRLALDRPARVPEYLLELGANRRIAQHAMHSTSDWLAFSTWERGDLRRSLSLSPAGGIVEDIGTRYEFEAPFWAGDEPAGPTLDGDPYPLPFHPLELGEAALRHLFGFVIEDIPDLDDVPAEDIELYGFRTVDPTGAEAAEREAALEDLMNRADPARMFRFNPDGTMSEVS